VADTILTDEDGTRYSMDNIRTLGSLRGHASGLDTAVEWLMERAVTLFREGKIEEATGLRKLSADMLRSLRPTMEERARRHEREFPIVVEDETNEEAR